MFRMMHTHKTLLSGLLALASSLSIRSAANEAPPANPVQYTTAISSMSISDVLKRSSMASLIPDVQDTPVNFLDNYKNLASLINDSKNGRYGLKGKIAGLNSPLPPVLGEMIKRLEYLKPAPGLEDKYLNAIAVSLAVVSTPEKFTEATGPFKHWVGDITPDVKVLRQSITSKPGTNSTTLYLTSVVHDSRVSAVALANFSDKRYGEDLTAGAVATGHGAYIFSASIMPGFAQSPYARALSAAAIAIDFLRSYSYQEGDTISIAEAYVAHFCIENARKWAEAVANSTQYNLSAGAINAPGAIRRYNVGSSVLSPLVQAGAGVIFGSVSAMYTHEKSNELGYSTAIVPSVSMYFQDQKVREIVGCERTYLSRWIWHVGADYKASSLMNNGYKDSYDLFVARRFPNYSEAKLTYGIDELRGHFLGIMFSHSWHNGSAALDTLEK